MSLVWCYYCFTCKYKAKFHWNCFNFFVKCSRIHNTITEYRVTLFYYCVILLTEVICQLDNVKKAEIWARVSLSWALQALWIARYKLVEQTYFAQLTAGWQKVFFGAADQFNLKFLGYAPATTASRVPTLSGQNRRKISSNDHLATRVFNWANPSIIFLNIIINSPCCVHFFIDPARQLGATARASVRYSFSQCGLLKTRFWSPIACSAQQQRFSTHFWSFTIPTM